MLDVLLALDRRYRGRVLLVIDEPLHAVLLGEALDQSFAMLNTRRTRSLVTPT